MTQDLFAKFFCSCDFCDCYSQAIFVWAWLTYLFWLIMSTLLGVEYYKQLGINKNRSGFSRFSESFAVITVLFTLLIYTVVFITFPTGNFIQANADSEFLENLFIVWAIYYYLFLIWAVTVNFIIHLIRLVLPPYPPSNLRWLILICIIMIYFEMADKVPRA